ncbi:MAG: tetratricopeptide repeat protein [Pseudomonadota bacterium]
MGERGGIGRRLSAVVLVLLAGQAAVADDNKASSKTVLGPSNYNLYDGAQELLAGNIEEGVRLTVLGLKMHSSQREEKIGHSNLCAGYLMLRQYETALYHCNWVLERDENHWRTYNNRALVYLAMERFEESEADIRRGQQLNPKSEKLKEVKGMYLDEVEPVSENITIDDRRNTPDNPVPPPEQ